MNQIGIRAKKNTLESGYVYAPYIPLIITPTIAIPKHPIYDDPIKKIKADMGYKIEPDRWEEELREGIMSRYYGKGERWRLETL